MKLIKKIEPVVARAVVSKTRVAAYCRVSTGMDGQLVSLETQRSHYEELISSNPEWIFAGIYYDEGITGTSKEKRPALMQMVADCEAGRIDRVLTKSLSRFARNTTDCLELVRKLLGLGVTIYFEKENLDTGTMESELLLSIMSSLAESESVSTSENNKWGVRHRFQNGTFKISYAPYGYIVQNGELIVNEEEAVWVRWIFAQALEGKTCTAIARQLNEKKVPTKRNGTWTENTVRGMLTNEKYIGDCLFQKTYTDFRFKRHVNRDEQDKFYVKDHHEAIISREDFEIVGALIEQRAREKNIKKNGSLYGNRYPFSGRIICGECGSTLKRHMTLTGGNRYPIWVCRQHLEDLSSCSMKAVRESDLEYAFTTMMNKLIYARKALLENLRVRIREEGNRGNLRRINEIEQMLEKNVERQQTLTTLMTQGYVDPAFFTKESNEIASETDKLKAEKEQLGKEVTGNLHKMDELDDLIRYAAHAQPAPDFNGELVFRFLDHATLRSRDEITFHLKCGLSLTERLVRNG